MFYYGVVSPELGAYDCCTDAPISDQLSLTARSVPDNSCALTQVRLARRITAEERREARARDAAAEPGDAADRAQTSGAGHRDEHFVQVFTQDPNTVFKPLAPPAKSLLLTTQTIPNFQPFEPREHELPPRAGVRQGHDARSRQQRHRRRRQGLACQR